MDFSPEHFHSNAEKRDSISHSSDSFSLVGNRQEYIGNDNPAHPSEKSLS